MILLFYKYFSIFSTSFHEFQIAIIYTRGGKRILRSPTKTSNVSVTGDLGWWRLQARRNMKKLVYWRNIFFLPDSSLVKQIYDFSNNSRKKTSWAHQIKKLLIQYELVYLWENPNQLLNLDNKNNNESKNINDHKKFWKNYIRKKILAYEEKEWIKEVNKKSKLRTYVKLKKKLCLEKYLCSNGKTLGRHIHTSLRNGANFLEIERGRWDALPEELRICKHCDLKVPRNRDTFCNFLSQISLITM